MNRCSAMRHKKKFFLISSSANLNKKICKFGKNPLVVLTDEYVIKFSLRMCRDIVLELLLYGDRRRHTKLERVCRRFHWTIENLFAAKHFLRLSLQLCTKSLYLIIPIIKCNYRNNKCAIMLSRYLKKANEEKLKQSIKKSKQ